jgi:hypothetical protein
VTERIQGCFAAQAGANDGVGRYPECTQACCNGNQARMKTVTRFVADKQIDW